MTTYKYLLWSVPVLLTVAVLVKIGADDAPTVAPQTSEISSQPDQQKNQEVNVKRIEVGTEETSRLENQDVKDMKVQKEEYPFLKNQDVKEIEIRKEEEYRSKKQDKAYTQHAKELAKQYEETAKLVARNGGDSKALLDAAAYFENESK
jgi:hypothetical protein